MSEKLPEKAERKTYPFRLTPKARMAAFFDAQGMTTIQIAKVCDLSDRTTISHWRNEPLYLAERDRWLQQTKAQLEPMIQKLQVGYLALLEDARDQLALALIATDPDGHAVWPTRLQAIKLLGDSPLVKAMFASGSGEGSAKAGAAAQSIVHLHIQKGEGDDVVDIKQVKEEEVEDG